jgi:hypothetical protein
MIFLLNVERVFSEVLTLARVEIAHVLGLSIDQVSVTLERDGNRIVPNFGVNTEVDTAFEEELISKVVREIWLEKVKPECEARLEGLFQTRYEIEKTNSQKTEAKKETSEETSS